MYQINPVKVSRRNGINYVFNGQHTIEIVALVSGSRETPVWCMVYDDLGYEHEADIFANQMKYVKPLLPYEIFMANIEAGNDKQLIIRDLVESYDLTIASTTTPGGICAVATLENIHDIQRAEEIPAPAPEGADIMDMKTEKSLELRRDVRKFAEENPEIAAQMVKNWLREGDDAG